MGIAFSYGKMAVSLSPFQLCAILKTLTYKNNQQNLEEEAHLAKALFFFFESERNTPQDWFRTEITFMLLMPLEMEPPADHFVRNWQFN